MTRVLVNGAYGRMGKMLTDLLSRRPGFSLAAGVDPQGREGYAAKLGAVRAEADVLLDVSRHDGAAEVAEYLMRRSLPAVICTTGHTRQELDLLQAAALRVPVLLASNTSLGAVFLARAVRQAAALFPQADVEILECHHTQKLDAPSGTAFTLAQAVEEGRGGHGGRAPGIHSLRMGSVVGEHTVILNAGSQTITLTHTAHDRVLFAEGALAAGEFIAGRPAGLYSMADLLTEKETL